MNFLAHLWLAERARLPLAGAVLGDWFRGALPEDLPDALARSVRLHRRIDAQTDRHHVVRGARERFAPGARRYAGILLDILCDHALALDWSRYHTEPLDDFAARAAQEVAAAERWFRRAGGPPVEAAAFCELLLSYRTESGLESAVERTARRLRRPEGLILAMRRWREVLPGLRQDLPVLLGDLSAPGESEGPRRF